MKNSADGLLLSTKLKIPAPRKNYVVRRALYGKLARCADTGVIFVRGGAGTGKTTLLSSFIRETGLKNVGWLSLDASNANVYSFWLYFTAAINTFLADDDGFLTLMRSNPDLSHMEDLLTILINRLCSDEDYYLVLDDVHYLNDAALIRTFEYFLGAMPQNFHLFMLSREDPPVYLGALAVSGRLLFIDGKQMQLSPAEGLTFLKQTLQLDGSDEELHQLNAYAEGWIGGLQLAAAAGAAGKYSGDLLRAGGGIAAAYLTREIFASLTRQEQDFLVGTGFLSYFDAEICACLFAGFSKAQFDGMIETLTRKNLFIICIDEQNGIYRYHNILSEYLTQQFSALTEEHKALFHTKAAQAFERREDLEEALKEFCAAADYDNALRVAQSMGGKIEAWSYLDQIPLERLILNADLAVQCFLYNLGNLNIERCRLLYEKFKEHYSDSNIFHAMRFADAYITTGQNILPEYHAMTAEEIDSLPFGTVTKAMILVENSAALLERMEYAEAESCVNQAIQTCAGTNTFVDLFAYNQMAQIYEETGRLNDSLACYDKSRKLIRSPAMMSGIGTNFYFGIAGVYMQRMELAKAAETLEHSRRLLEEQRIHVDITDMTLSYHLAEMKFLSGDAAAGAAHVEGILSEYPAFSVLTLGRLLHELACAGLLPPKLAGDFLRELETTQSLKFQPFMRLLRARILFEQAETEAAFRETEKVLTFARARKNKLRLVDAGLLKIVMLSRSPESSGRRREISNLLREAVYYAHEDRILMPFYLDRTTLVPLMRDLIAQPPDKNALSAAEITFVRDAIVLSGGPAVPADKQQEILSVRELEVLGELAQGITNREIAEKLCISQATVKTHVLSIFGKLGVSSRMMAVKAGQEKGLI